MKAIIEFDLNDPDERAAHKLMLKSTEMQIALYRIAEDLFRPARKHGYPDESLAKLAKGNEELIEELESRFYRILEELEVSAYE